MFSEKKIIKLAKLKQKTIVFPEAGYSDRIVEAGYLLNKKRIAKVIFLGDESSLVLRYKDKLKGITIINPKTSTLFDELLNIFLEKRKNKGLDKKQAEKLLLNPLYFGTLLVEAGYADGMVAGAEEPSANVIRPALQILKSKNENEIVSSFMMFYGKGKVFKKRKVILGSDCGLNINPSAEELSQIAIQTAKSYELFTDKKAKIAMLSYSTNGSSTGDSVDKVKTATALVKRKKFDVYGEVQLDSAISKRVSDIKCPSWSLDGEANVLIFPDLNSGNITYKAIQYFGKIKAIGPIMQNLKKPVNDLSRGCSVRDIILVSAITALQV